MQRDAIRVVEGEATAWPTIEDQARREGRDRRLAALVQTRPAAFDAGLHQSDALRAGLTCQSTMASQLMRSAMGYGFQGQGQISCAPTSTRRGVVARNPSEKFASP